MKKTSVPKYVLVNQRCANTRAFKVKKRTELYVTDLLKGRRTPGPAVLKIFKLEAVTQYREARVTARRAQEGGVGDANIKMS